MISGKTYLTPFIYSDMRKAYCTYELLNMKGFPYSGVCVREMPDGKMIYRFSWCSPPGLLDGRCNFFSLDEAKQALVKLLTEKYNCEFISQEKFDKLKVLL